jgi:hypothetical protein
MSVLKALVDYKSGDSLALQYRRRRFQFFQSLLDRLPRPVRILDVGGTEAFWRIVGFDMHPGLQITTINLDPVKPCTLPNLTPLQGDARDLSRFTDGSFDVAFSNSLIEHVGGRHDQRRVASEIQRVGKAYWVQTPNRHFPLEPHFLFPFFQYLPVSARVYLLTHFNIGWTGKLDTQEAREFVESIELLDRRTFCELFPTAQIWDERAFGLVKSFVAYGGFPPLRPERHGTVLGVPAS